ncbi:MAG: hypothetical protein AAF725_13615 [Acidobacteriota bacterium]
MPKKAQPARPLPSILRLAAALLISIGCLAVGPAWADAPDGCSRAIHLGASDSLEIAAAEPHDALWLRVDVPRSGLLAVEAQSLTGGRALLGSWGSRCAGAAKTRTAAISGPQAAPHLLLYSDASARVLRVGSGPLFFRLAATPDASGEPPWLEVRTRFLPDSLSYRNSGSGSGGSGSGGSGSGGSGSGGSGSGGGGGTGGENEEEDEPDGFVADLCGGELESDDHGDSGLCASSLRPRSKTEGILESAGDRDVFRLDLTRDAGLYALAIEAYGADVALLDAAGNRLASSSDSCGRDLEERTWVVAGVYYLEISAKGELRSPEAGARYALAVNAARW